MQCCNIIEEREKNGPYKDIYDLAERVNLNTLNKKNARSAWWCQVRSTAFRISSGHSISLPTARAQAFSRALSVTATASKTYVTVSQQSLFGEAGGFELVQTRTCTMPRLVKAGETEQGKTGDRNLPFITSS
ncbi:MAG: hypothetical protein MZW92_68450 [Comamonadaceae bacterium]|nr:hypothetical protein [Comamonadaceae bacterium]